MNSRTCGSVIASSCSLSLLKTRLSQRSCVVRSDRLLAGHDQMAWDPSWDTALRGSHAPRVGAGESRAEAATRRMESASATAAADGDGPDLLDRVVETLEELAEFLAGGAARDRGAVGTAGASGSTGHGRVDADGVGPRLGETCGI